MSEKKYILRKENLRPLLEEMSKTSEVYVPAQDSKNCLFDFFKLNEIGPEISFGDEGGKRYSLDTTEKTRMSPKFIIYPQYEKMLDFKYRKDPEKLDEVNIDIDAATEAGKTVIFGIKPCDVEAVKRMDKVFTEGIVKDPYYTSKRQGSLLISIGCEVAFEDCFCTMVGGKPFNFENADIGLMETEDGYAVMHLSEKGSKAVQEFERFFDKAQDDGSYEKQMQKKQEDTSSRISSLWEGIKAEDIPVLMDSAFNISSWKKVSEKCISCGACTFVCPTCYCFDIRDEQESHTGERYRCWDFCTNYLYTLEASGHNPRSDINKRYKNKVNCKYNYNFKRHDGLLYCVGCGRCVDVCPADMDIRQIVGTILKKSRS
jgi:sulfhydrogenase subunit beta (sulfur reductase)